jgi:hypothetical protein
LIDEKGKKTFKLVTKWLRKLGLKVN